MVWIVYVGTQAGRGMGFLADTLNPSNIVDYIQSGGVIALLVVFFFGLNKKWWVMGWQYKEKEDEVTRWMELALRSTNLAESLERLRRERPL